MTSTLETQILQCDTGISFPMTTNIVTIAPPIQGQIVAVDASAGFPVVASPLGMYVLELDSYNYFGQIAPINATNPFPAGDGTATTGYVDYNVWFPNLVLPVVNEPAVFWNTDVNGGSPVYICSSGNGGYGLQWTSSAGITQLSVMIYSPSSAFVATNPP